MRDSTLIGRVLGMAESEMEDTGSCMECFRFTLGFHHLYFHRTTGVRSGTERATFKPKLLLPWPGSGYYEGAIFVPAEMT